MERLAEFEGNAARMQNEIDRMEIDSAELGVRIAESTTKYHYLSYRNRAIELNRAMINYVRRATGFHLPNTAERLPVLK